MRRLIAGRHGQTGFIKWCGRAYRRPPKRAGQPGTRKDGHVVPIHSSQSLALSRRRSCTRHGDRGGCHRKCDGRRRSRSCRWRRQPVGRGIQLVHQLRGARGGEAHQGRPRSRRSRIDEARAYDAKFNSGNPKAAAAARQGSSRRRIKTGTNPIKFKTGKAKNQQTAKLLTILVEFNDAANDDFSGVMVPEDRVRRPHLRRRAGRHDQERPAAQQHPQPGDFKATTGYADNNSFWVPGLQRGALRQDALHEGGHHRARSART